MTEQEVMERQERIMDLLFEVDFPTQFAQFLDLNSADMLDDKIEVLEALKAGREIADIPKFYDVLELMPKDGIWD